MSSQPTEVQNQLQDSILDAPEPAKKLPAQHPDEEEDRLISKQSSEDPSPAPHKESEKQKQNEVKDNVIDPLEQLVKNNDVVPLLAVLNKVNLTTKVEGKPLLSRLCTMHIPLTHILKDREIIFTKDDDNRTALHEAIAADDLAAANWCIQNKIGNHRDNFGLTPILEAIKHGRRACFLLCLHYEYYDSEASHYCAIYNRAWQLRVLNKLGIDVLWQRDSQHLTPLQRAVENYSYDAAEFLTQLSGEMSMTELAGRTDSKGILRLIKRIRKQNNFFCSILLPLLCLIANFVLFYETSKIPIFSAYKEEITLALLAIAILNACIYLFSWMMAPDQVRTRPNLLALLRGPEFPPLADICPHCLVFQEPGKEHCLKCKNCVQRLHHHQVVCVNKSNEIFSLFIQIFWFWLSCRMNCLFLGNLAITNLKILNFSSNFFFENAAAIESMLECQQYMQLGLFLYIKIFMVYQFCCIFQWLYMLVLDRTYREVNNSERYTRLYRIGRTSDGSYKCQQNRLMETGLVGAFVTGLKNTLTYFLK